MSPDLLQPGREFSIPTPLSDILHQLMCSSHLPQLPQLPATLGFAAIGLPGSLSGPSVLMDTLSLDLSSLMQPLSLSNLGLLSTGWAQPVVPVTSVDSTILPSAVSPIAADRLVEPVITGQPLTPLNLPSLLPRFSILLTGRFAGHCRPPRCSQTAPFIVPLIVRQARHR